GLSDRLEEWATEYKAEGRQEGRQEGERLALQRLLTKRFGAIPAAYTDRISTASEAEVEVWLERVLDAPSLEAVFEPMA
ncbi:DUF4351 domain-containing protein, partial [Thiohalocapsa marina]